MAAEFSRHGGNAPAVAASSHPRRCGPQRSSEWPAIVLARSVYKTRCTTRTQPFQASPDE